MTTPDPLDELRALAVSWRGKSECCDLHAAASDAAEACAADLDRILSRLGEARVMLAPRRQLAEGSGAIIEQYQPHLVIPIKETDRAD